MKKKIHESDALSKNGKRWRKVFHDSWLNASTGIDCQSMVNVLTRTENDMQKVSQLHAHGQLLREVEWSLMRDLINVTIERLSWLKESLEIHLIYLKKKSKRTDKRKKRSVVQDTFPQERWCPSCESESVSIQVVSKERAYTLCTRDEGAGRDYFDPQTLKRWQ